jgi:hypothetical protein
MLLFVRLLASPFKSNSRFRHAEVRILPPQPASQSLTHTESGRARNAKPAPQTSSTACAFPGSGTIGHKWPQHRSGVYLAPTSLSRMVHSSFSTDPAEVSASRHPNARRFFRSRPETDRRAQWARRGDLPPSVQVQSCLEPGFDHLDAPHVEVKAMSSNFTAL